MPLHVANIDSINVMNDVDTTGIAENKILRWDGSNFVEKTIKRTKFFGQRSETNTGTYKMFNMANGDSHYFSFHIPDDFVSLNNMKIICVPPNSTSKQIDWYCDYGSAGESYITHSESNTGNSYSVTTDQVNEITIPLTFTSLSAGDYIGFHLNKVTTGFLNLIGLKMDYNGGNY